MKLNLDKLTPLWEAIKEPLRWGLLYVVSWVITQLLEQVNVVPESFDIKVWEFIFSIPLRVSFIGGLTIALRFVDKLLHEIGKKTEQLFLAKGLTRF